MWSDGKANMLPQIVQDYALAERTFKRALITDSKHIRALTSYAFFCAHALNDYPKSDNLLAQAIAIDNNYVPAITQVGVPWT